VVTGRYATPSAESVPVGDGSSDSQAASFCSDPYDRRCRSSCVGGQGEPSRIGQYREARFNWPPPVVRLEPGSRDVGRFQLNIDGVGLGERWRLEDLADQPSSPAAWVGFFEGVVPLIGIDEKR